MMPPEPVLSVVLPMYDEAQVLDRCLITVVRQLEVTGLPFEIVCVDDGSRDATPELLDDAAATDPRIVAVHLARNFGKEAAVAAGLEASRGHAVLLMDADLQHPPRLIPAMIDRWRAGFDVVEAVKADRGREGWAYRAAAAAFYLLMGSALGASVRGSSDFKLLDRQVVEAVLACPERNRFFRGLVAWAGFRVARLPFEVEARAGGETKWSWRALVRYSLRNLVAFSSTPLWAIAWLGFGMVAVDGLLAVHTFWNWWRGAAVDGFTTVILSTGLLGGLVLASLGVVAIYVAQLYEELKGRPVYVARRPRPQLPARVTARVEALRTPLALVSRVDALDTWHTPMT